MSKNLGKTQTLFLDALIKHKHWHDGCGWIWGSHSQTIRLLHSLANRGLVVYRDGRYLPVVESRSASTETHLGAIPQNFYFCV